MSNIKLSNYLKPREWVIDKIYFDYEEKRFEGRGILRWDSAKGFSIDAPLWGKLNRSIRSKRKLLTKSDLSSIRMHLRNNGIAIAPSVPLVDRLDIILEERISIYLPNVIFLQCSDPPIGGGKHWRGDAIYKSDSQKINRFLDPVEVKTQIKVNKEYTSESSSLHLKGIYYQDENDNRIVIYSIDENYIYCNWHLNKNNLTKAEAKRFPEAIQYALSILSGKGICLLQYELFYGHQRRVEIRKDRPRNSLGDFPLLASDISDRKTLKTFFYKLCVALSKKTKEALICKNILEQVSEAVHQNNWYVKELLIATTLEAILRNIDEEPFDPKKNKWQVGYSLNNFLSKYFSRYGDISELKIAIMKSHAFLRDRNAHPDWLFKQGGYLSEQEMEKSFDSMAYLTHFYGYVIFALLDFDDIELRWPKSISQQEPHGITTPPS